ncbi:S-protein homolog 2 [Linum grandiflorum]
MIIAMAGSPSSGGDGKEKVTITNELSLMLIVHCGSKQDDLKAHAVHVATGYSWSFTPTCFFKTLYWCNLAVQDKRLHFDAYSGFKHYESSTVWVVKDDGVHQNYTNDFVAWNS